MTPLWILSGVAFAIAGLVGGLYHHKLVALWAAFAGVVLSLAAITVWLHGIITGESNPSTDMPRDRPWLSIDVIPAGDITFAQDGNASFPLGFSTSNSGSMPANNARLSAEIVFPKPGPELLTGPIKRRDEICKGALLDTTGVWQFGTVFAKPVGVEITFSGNAPTMAAQFASLGHDESQKFIGPFVVGCVTYNFSANNSTFSGQTGFIYEVSAGIPGKRGTRYIPLGENIPESEVVIRKPAINGDFAK